MPQFDLALAAGAAVDSDSGTISFCVECSGMMAMCLCRWNKFGILSVLTITLSLNDIDSPVVVGFV